MMGIGASSIGTDLDYIEGLYHAGHKKGIMSRYSNEMTKPFTQVREKTSVTYTEDGKRLINGELQELRDGISLWQSVIHSMALGKPVDKILEKEMKKMSKKDKKSIKKVMQRLIHGKVEEHKMPAEQWHNVVFSTIHEAQDEEIEKGYNKEIKNYEILTKEPIRRESLLEKKPADPAKLKRRVTMV